MAGKTGSRRGMVVGTTTNGESGSCQLIGPHILLSRAASTETSTYRFSGQYVSERKCLCFEITLPVPEPGDSGGRASNPQASFASSLSQQHGVVPLRSA